MYDYEEEVDKRRKALEGTNAHWLADVLYSALDDKGTRWFGVPASRNPIDAWIYQEILWETRPDVVVEIGSLYGGTTLFLAHMMDLLGLSRGRVISVDINPEPFVSAHERIIHISGDCGAYKTYQQIEQLVARDKAMVIHDANHSAGAVARDLALYSGLVSLGCYLVVEDGIVDVMMDDDYFGGYADGGPMKAIVDFLNCNPEFELDESREKFGLTYNQMGFLKRV